jgi:hypothetical protein
MLILKPPALPDSFKQAQRLAKLTMSRPLPPWPCSASLLYPEPVGLYLQYISSPLPKPLQRDRTNNNLAIHLATISPYPWSYVATSLALLYLLPTLAN